MILKKEMEVAISYLMETRKKKIAYKYFVQNSSTKYKQRQPQRNRELTLLTPKTLRTQNT